jgi:MoxR-like ATPase
MVKIGDVQLKLEGESRPELVPVGFGLAEEEGQETLADLKWMLQKFSLGQDMFLLSGPGPTARRLALHFCEVVGVETELVRITRDTTESDLKVRREISGGTASWSDQAPVRAAIHGRVLIIDGIEKAERNVLPTLNNLLENREMALEDGRFLVSAARYDELAAQPEGEAHIRAASLVRVHPNFRVIALGLPVPKFYGFPLDPPLRSRFQARVVGAFSADRVLSDAGPVLAKEPLRACVTKLLSLAQTLRALEDSDNDAAPRHVLGGSAAGLHLSKRVCVCMCEHGGAVPE